ncbi:MAG: hypothetical protein K2W85_09630 [Phycisphaerales bacterium]|nr:hypothetical protein [Phycisphaerales bacterium]
MARVYLETSFVSACVTDREDVASAYRREVSTRWWNTQRDRHEVSISAEVIAELSSGGFRRGAEALSLIRGMPLLDIDDDVRGVAEVLVRELVMPRPAAGDALHVAVCCVRSIDCVLSWNVQPWRTRAKLRIYG